MKTNKKRLIDANDAEISLFALRKGYRHPHEKCAVGGCITLIRDLPTVDAIPVTEIEAYLHARLDEWEALGDRKWDAANMWGYNFIMACFDDLETRNNLQ